MLLLVLVALVILISACRGVWRTHHSTPLVRLGTRVVLAVAVAAVAVGWTVIHTR